jgi:tripartite-type tricarboxylate transporter receptor subunit TctC
VIIDNKAGAAGSIGALEVKNAKPDGYTLLIATSSTHAVNPTAYVKPPYDAVKDFTPISSICLNPLILVTHPSMPDSIKGLIDPDEEEPVVWMFETFLDVAAASQGRQAAHPGLRPFQARADCTRDPDPDRGWRAGLRSLHLQPDRGTGRHAQGGRRHKASRKLMADKEMIKFLEDIAAVPTTETTPQITAKFIGDDIAKWAPVIRAAGVKIE